MPRKSARSRGASTRRRRDSGTDGFFKDGAWCVFSFFSLLLTPICMVLRLGRVRATFPSTGPVFRLALGAFFSTAYYVWPYSVIWWWWWSVSLPQVRAACAVASGDAGVRFGVRRAFAC
ncbi:hypothetical protein B0H19DRAFT_1138468 [Mycena capillaripes]|nr:hypothetical protein B0H19DRAFT_1138468 [Mycena capillaripes]